MTAAAVPSVDPLSTTTTSHSPPYVWRLSASSCSPMMSAALRAGITTLTAKGLRSDGTTCLDGARSGESARRRHIVIVSPHPCAGVAPVPARPAVHRAAERVPSRRRRGRRGLLVGRRGQRPVRRLAPALARALPQRAGVFGP